TYFLPGHPSLADALLDFARYAPSEEVKARYFGGHLLGVRLTEGAIQNLIQASKTFHFSLEQWFQSESKKNDFDSAARVLRDAIPLDTLEDRISQWFLPKRTPQKVEWTADHPF